jgi:hypothetical protein
MKKLLLLAALAAASIYAQSPDNGDYVITGSLDMTTANWAAPIPPVLSDPTGSCSHPYQLTIDSSGHQFACLSSTWTALNTGGLSGLTTHTVLRACSATTGCNSALSDDGTNVTSTEPLIVQVTSGAPCSSWSCIVFGTFHTPASSSETCTAGTLTMDATFLYLCKATNTWVRSAWSTF